MKSDHYMVRTRIRLRLSMHRNRNKVKPKLDVERLKDERTQKRYCEAVKEKLLEHQNENQSMEEMWRNQKNAYLSAGEEVLGYRKGKSKPWITDKSWKLIDERRDIKMKIESTHSERIKERLKADYKEKDKGVKKSVREDKRKWIADKAKTAQTAAENGWQKELHDVVKQLTGKSYRQTAAVKGKEGKLLKSKSDRLARWKEHFQEVLNREAPDQPPEEGEDKPDELDIDVEAPNLEEIQKAVNSLKNGKAPGVDQVTAEMLKADSKTTSSEFKKIFDIIWEEEQVPTQWTQGLICKIPKKGNLQECGNWRGVTLLPLASKVLSKILISRIQGGVDSLLRKEQAGFRRGRGTVDQIFILRNILEQVNEWNATLYIHFVDFEKAFDSIHRDSQWIIMQQYGIPHKLIRMVQALYDGFQCAVIDENETTEWFPVMTGVKQGCCMSGFLFLLAIDWVMRKTVEGGKTGIRWNFMSVLEDLDFADDIALLSSTMQHLQQKTRKLEENAAMVGLKLNDKKCKIMKTNSKSEDKLQVQRNDVEEVESFTYLGAVVTQDGGGTADVKKRVALASGQFKKLAGIWKAGDISKKTKTSLFRSLVLSVLCYGCETWKLTKGEERALDSFQNRCLRRIYKVHWSDHTTNEEVLMMAGTEKMSRIVMERRWKWIGHVLRKVRSDDCAVALGWAPEGRRRRGRPKMTWRRMVEMERDGAGWKSWDSARQAAGDRQQWRENVLALCASRHEEK